ncbi:hypothetical protein [Capnocytophaga bilenii]
MINVLKGGIFSSRTGFYLSVRAARASHTRLRQLADFPSLILRSSFAEGSVRQF